VLRKPEIAFAQAPCERLVEQRLAMLQMKACTFPLAARQRSFECVDQQCIVGGVFAQEAVEPVKTLARGGCGRCVRVRHEMKNVG